MVDVKVTHMPVSKTNHIVIVFEYDFWGTLPNIDEYLCSEECSSAKEIPNSQQNAFASYVIEELESQINVLAQRNNQQMSLEFGCFEKSLMIAVTLENNMTMLKKVIGAFGSAFYTKSLKPIIEKIKKVDPKFYQEHGESKIEQSLRYLQDESLDVCILCKLKEEKISTSMVKGILDKFASKIEFSKENPIKNQSITLQYLQSLYPYLGLGEQGHFNLDNVHEVFKTLIVANLNNQGIQYSVHTGRLLLDTEFLTTSAINDVIKSIISSLAFTNERKTKLYRDAKDSVKQKFSMEEFRKKENQSKQKKEQAFLQSLAMSGAVRIEDLLHVQSTLSGVHIDRVMTIPKKIKEHLLKYIKYHKEGKKDKAKESKQQLLAQKREQAKQEKLRLKEEAKLEKQRLKEEQKKAKKEASK